MKKIGIILSMCVLFAGILHGQIQVSGKLMDKETDLPIAQVNVLFKPFQGEGSFGAVSASDGQFQLMLPEEGSYLVTYSHLGYKTKKDTLVLKKTVSLGLIKLKPDGKNLKEVKIEEQQKSVYDDDSDKRTYSPDERQLQAGASVVDFLQTLPSLNVSTKGKISLRGNSHVTIMIDGKLAGVSRSSVKAILENLPVASIERVEIYDNPSAKMNAQGSGGIINIITKKGANDGFTGSVSLNVGMRDKANASVYLSVRKKKLGFYATYGYRYGLYANTGSDTGVNRIPPSVEWNYSKKAAGREIEGAHSVGFGLDWSPNKTNTLTLSGFGNYVYNVNKSQAYYKQYFDGQAPFESFVRDVYTLSNELNVEGALLWTKKFKKPKQQWDTELNYGYNYDNSFSQLGRLRSGLSQNRETDQTKRFHFLSFRSDFVLPISASMKFETGVRYTARFIQTDFDARLRDEGTLVYMPDSFLINSFSYKEHVAAFYGEFTHKIKKWKYRLGFRGEPTFISTYLENGAISNTRFYMGWFPFAGIYRDITKRWDVKLTYARRISRPKPGSLNPFTDYSDPLDLRFGNPLLNPEFSNNIELGLQYKKEDYLFKASVFGKLYETPYGRFRYLDTSNVVVTTTLNYKGEQQAGLELIGSAKVFKALTLTANVNLYYTHIDATNIIPGLTNSLFGYETKFSASWFVPKVFSGMFVFNYRGPEIMVQGQSYGTWRMDLSIRRSFWKNRITLSASVQDIFNTWYGYKQTQTYDLDRYSVRKSETRIFMAGITFRFGKKKINDADGEEENDFKDRNNNDDNN